MARSRRRKSKNTIDLQKAWTVKQTKKEGGMKVRATPLKIQLDEEAILRPLGEDMIARYREVITETRAKPKKSTLRRRGPGDLFNVTGKFLSSIRYRISRGNLFLETDRLSPGVKGWLQRRIKGTRPIELKRWLARTGKLDELMRTEVIESGFTSRGTGIPPQRLAGIVRRRKR